MNDRIEVVEYDPAWPARYLREQRVLAEALGVAALDIQHVGSTSVVGLAAKPVIDILVAAADPAVLDVSGDRPAPDASCGTWLAGEPAAHREFVERVVKLGYLYHGRAEIPGRLYFRRNGIVEGEERRTHHLHVCIHGSAFWHEHVLFRDYLRAHASVRDDYAALKRRLALRYPDDRVAYSDAKGPFIRAVLERARRGMGE